VLTGSHAFHDLFPRLQALTPVVLPLEQIAGMQCVSPQLKHASELSRRGGRPEAELLHETGFLRLDELLQLVVEFGELGVVLDRVERLVVAGVALVLPDVDESVAVADFGAPGADEVDLLFLVSLPKNCEPFAMPRTLFSGMFAIFGYQLPTSSTYSSTLLGFTSWKTMLCTYLPRASTCEKLRSISWSIFRPSSVP
jgi:hypothetical protein